MTVAGAPLSLDSIREQLTTRIIGRHLVVHGEVDSTNRVATVLAGNGAAFWAKPTVMGLRGQAVVTDRDRFVILDSLFHLRSPRVRGARTCRQPLEKRCDWLSDLSVGGYY